jgi:Tfp pilus assembly protein PilO
MIGIFIVAFNIGVRLYKAQSTRLDSIRAEISLKEKEIEHLKDIQTQQLQIAKLKENFKKIELSVLVSRVTELANHFDLKVLIVDQQKKTESNLFNILSFRLSVEGKYHNIGKFLSEIENFEEFTKIENITLVPKADNSENKGNVIANIFIVCSTLKQ